MSVTISTAHHCTTAGMGSVGMMGTLNLVRPPQVPQVAALRAYVKSLSSVYKSNAEFLQVPCAFITHTGNAIQRKMPTYMFVYECPYLYVAE